MPDNTRCLPKGLLAGGLVFLLLLCSGCTNTIRPPADPREPVTVYLLDHGRHPSLVLPRPDGCLTRYVYGDWNWYALGNEGIFDALSAILWPTRGTLGRWESPNSNLSSILWLDSADHVYTIRVPREKAEKLRQRLDGLFQANLATLHTNSEYHLDFVHAPDAYCAFHNCNQVMGQWLRELGCRVNGTTMLSNWRVRQPASGGQ